MTLPTVKSLQDCADYSKIVEPFIPQLFELRQKLRETSMKGDAIAQVYVETNPLIFAAGFSIFLGFIFLVTAEINRNYSQVDRAWSILPAVYVGHFSLWARLTGEPHQRIDLAATFAAVWSVRLTYNYWRKGGYNIGSEDYRWAVIRSWKFMHPLVFSLFNLLFIAFLQSFLLFFFSAVPAYVIFLANRLEPEITMSDYAFFCVEFALVLSELISDGQQWHYQNAKRRYQKSAQLPGGFSQDELDRGFITLGLWAYSRHPNFAAEQLIWFVLYQWSCYASQTLYSFAGIGSLSLVLLFQGSTWITEAITGSKYPEYKEYRKQVGRFLPTSFGGFKMSADKPKVIRTTEPAKSKKET